jgi:hypothetical protein
MDGSWLVLVFGSDRAGRALAAPLIYSAAV